MIDSENAMRSAMAKLAGASSIALDLEMENNYHHYGLHIALIQVSMPRDAPFLFDPLSGIDLRPLGDLLVSPGAEKIIHDADFDKRACRQVMRWNIRNIFDTKVAAQFCGFRQYGLASLLGALLNVHTDKRFQKTDWLKRPLREDALDYAARETSFLFAIKDILVKRLDELGRLEWAKEEFERLESFAEPDNSSPRHRRIKGSAALAPRQLAVLSSLDAFRDGLAKKSGRPVHFIINNKTLLQLAVSPPRSVRELQKIRGLHPSVYRQENAELFMSAVEKGLTAPDKIPPRHARPASAPGYGARLKAMQKWRAALAESLDMEPHLLIPGDAIGWCARNPERPLPDDLAARIRNWQKPVAWNEFARQFRVPEQPAH